MRVIYSQAHEAHAPRTLSRNGAVAPFKDVPERIDTMLSVVRALGLEVTAPRDFGDTHILRLHSAEYLEFLRTAYPRWQALVASSSGSDLACADRYAVRHYQNRVPSSIQGQVGYYLSGSAVPLGASTYDAARSAAHVALEAAEILLAGERAAYALTRPPGHHAYRDLAGGYCYLNNAALAAEHLVRTLGRVAILDVDVHHGNGTQSHFYHRSDVFFVSVHADPNHAYPFYSGYADECGAEDGEGYTLNLPRPIGTDDAVFIEAVHQATAAIARYTPEALVVSLGLDAHMDDPQQLFGVSTDAFGIVGEYISRLKVPTVFVQEGGYGIGEVGRSLAVFLAGFGTSR